MNPSFPSASVHKQGVSGLLDFPVSARVLCTALSFVRGGGIGSTQQGSCPSLLSSGMEAEVTFDRRWDGGESRVGVAGLACGCCCQWLLQQAEPEGQIKLGRDGDAGGQQVDIS